MQPRAISSLPWLLPSPLISAIAVLSSSPSSLVSPLSTTVDATTTASASPFASLLSGFHRPRHRSPVSSATIAALRPSASVTKTEQHRRPPIFLFISSPSSRLLFLSTSDYYLDHRRRLPSLFLSLAPPSASQHHLPLLPLLRAHESSHRPLPPSPFPPPSTIELLSPFSLSVAVIPMPSPSSLASIDADLPLLSLSSLLHLVVGSLLLLAVTDPTSISPSAASLAPLRLHHLQTATTSLLPLRPPSSAAAVADLPVDRSNFSP